MKIRKWKRVISVLFAAAFAGLAVGCKDDKNSSSNSDGAGNNANGQFTFITTPRESYTPADTNIPLVENGESDYVIVVPKKVTVDITQAREELQNFFQRSTGILLETVFDTGLTFDESKKYISLGKTTVYEGSGLNLTYEEYGEDGFHIKRFGNTVIIGGADDDGVTYGIYDFLQYNLGVKIYGENTMVIPTHETVYLKDFDYKSIPDIKDRTMGISSAERYSRITEYRLGLSQDHGTNWITWCHTHFELLPKKTYYNDHKDWYSPDGTQLCLTNDEMITELIKVMKERIQDREDLVHGLFMLGHEDVSSFCTCDRCEAEKAQYGGENSAVMMRFINKVADIMNPWVEETYKGEKTFKWITFAYGKTVPPPVKQNADGSYAPVDESVVAHENVGVMIAPLGSDWAHSRLDAENNAKIKLAIEGWSAIEPEIYTYTYNVVFDNQFIFMDDWSYLKETFQIFEQMNTEYVFNDGTSFINLPFFELRTFVAAKLMWDLSLDVEALIDEFIEAYYKAAAPKVKEYFDLVRTRYRVLERELAAEGEAFHMYSYVRNDPDLVSAKWWPKEWLLNAIRIYDEALVLAEGMQAGEDRETTIRRVKAERLAPLYLLLELHRTSMTDAELRMYIQTFKDDCDVNSIQYYDQHSKTNGKTVQALINNWSTQLEK